MRDGRESVRRGCYLGETYAVDAVRDSIQEVRCVRKGSRIVFCDQGRKLLKILTRNLRIKLLTRALKELIHRGGEMVSPVELGLVTYPS